MAEVTFQYERHCHWDGRRIEEKWLKHYSSNHEILLVGEGDFSFALSLAFAFGSASNIVATSLDSYDEVINKYKKAKRNLEILHCFGAQLLHGVDAIKMKLHTDLRMRKFDRIVYNFPHAGFFGKEDDHRVIMKHKTLVYGFLKNASGMLRPNGEVHVSHKTTGPFQLWNIIELARHSSLVLLERVKFKIEDYPDYRNKRGDGKRSDEPFRLGECSTYKFILSSSMANHSLRHTYPYQPRHFSSQLGNATTVMNHDPVFNSPGCFRVFREYFDHPRATFRQRSIYSVPRTLRIGFERFEDINSWNDYSNRLDNRREGYLPNRSHHPWLVDWGSTRR